jgi:hypothetical protein
MKESSMPKVSPKSKIVSNQTESVVHPSHYGGGENPYEVIKVLQNTLTKEEFIGALKFNIIKYNLRAGKKDSSKMLQDHEKGAWYYNYLVAFLKETT